MHDNSSHRDISSVLADVADAVVGQLDMKALLGQIINSTMNTLNAEVCSIFLEDRDNEPGLLKCEAGSGFAKKIVGKAKYKIGEGFTGIIAKSGNDFNIKSREQLETLVIDGKPVWKGKHDNEQWPSGESEFRNGIGLPLKIKDQIVGVIKVENKINEDHFTDEDLINFKTIANVIALTIENVRLHQKTEKQSKTISSVLAEVAKAVVGKFDMQELLNQIINTTMETLHAEVCSIFLEDKEEEPGIINCVAGSGHAREIVGLARYKIGEGLTGTVFKHGIEYNSKNQKDHEKLVVKSRSVWKGKFDYLQWPKGESDFRNGIGLPLKIKDDILGVIKVENKIERYGDYFTDEDLSVFRTIANVIALAIENVRLHQKAEKQSKTTSSVLAEVGKAVVGKFDMQELLNQIINTTMETLHAEVCSIFLEDKEEEPGIINCVAGSGHAREIVGLARYKIGEGLTGAVFKHGIEYNCDSRDALENLTIHDTKVWKGKFDPSQWPSGKSEFRNGIGLPLKIKDETLGIIKVENKVESYGDYFTEDDFRTFKTIANVIALAIENARLHDKIETQLKAISAKAAHRINNQATNYDGIELDIEEELKDPTCNQPNFSKIHERLVKTTKDLKKMIAEFKDYGKPIVLEKEISHINKIVKNEVWYAKPPDELKIEIDLDDSIPGILLDEGRFAESIKELISNSREAIKQTHHPAGVIKITTKLIEKDVNQEVFLSIEDSGTGFPPNFPIFEPFNSTDPKSTGLGLATVKELVDKHGGSIRADKSQLGGASIEFTIPAVR